MSIRIPAPLRRDPTPGVQSLALYHRRARDLSLDCLSGQALTLTRTVARTATDSGGNTVSVVHSMPAYSARTLYDGLAYAGLTVGPEDMLATAAAFASQTLTGLSELYATALGNQDLWSVSNDAGSGAYLRLTSSATQYLWRYYDGATLRESTLSRTGDTNKFVRLRWVWNANGSVQVWKSVDGAAESAGTLSASLTRVAFPADAKVRENAFTATPAGLTGFLRDTKVFPDVQSLATLDVLI